MVTFVSFRQWRGGIIFIRRGRVNLISASPRVFYNGRGPRGKNNCGAADQLC